MNLLFVWSYRALNIHMMTSSVISAFMVFRLAFLRVYSSNLLHLKILASSESFIFHFSSKTLNLYHIRSRRILMQPVRSSLGLIPVVGCYTVLAWWKWDCQSGIRHGLTLLWLVGLKIDWDCPVPHCIMGSRDQWEFQLFFQTSVTVPLHCNCLPLGLCKGTVKESTVVNHGRL